MREITETEKCSWPSPLVKPPRSFRWHRQLGARHLRSGIEVGSRVG